ncbi:MAG TPA: HAMP domain-containing sensor histidine kinase [Euzebyales bacterium]|nr:HAMP domain-containing sensor histidine kinase [Euzebyales bacterium]
MSGPTASPQDPTAAARGERTRPERAATVGIRRQLIGWMLLAVGVAVLLLGVPLGLVLRQWVYAEELAQVRRTAQQVILVLNSNRDPASFSAAVTRSAELLGSRVTVLDGQGRVVRDSAGVAPGTVFDDRPVQRALEQQVGAEVLGGSLVVAVPDTIGTVQVIVRVAAPADDAKRRVGTVLVTIVVLGALALAVGAALAAWRARQLARPLEALAVSARRLGEGDFSPQAPRSAIAEIDHIAASLDVTAARLRTALERSASLSADASHQLRTPLTALRLNLEALAAELEGPSASLAAAEAEVDRLEATIDELLVLADAGARADVVDLRALTLERLEAWRTLADAAGRAVRVTRAPVPPVRARPAAVGQALQVLLDNALVHGHGDVAVWLEPVHRGDRTWVRLCVGDDGPGPSPDDLVSGDGRGLPLARSLIEAEGGRLVLDADHGNRVCLVVPAVDTTADQPVDDVTP